MAKFEKLIDYQELALYDQLMKQHIAKLLADYVKAEKGKGLSTNDLTDALLKLLNSVEEGAQKNVQADWNAETGNAAILNKPAIPSDNKSLTNGAGYQTAADVKTLVESYKYQTAADVAAAISAALSGEFVTVDTLPETGESGKIYLVPNGGSGQNVKDEYIWMASTKTYEMFGTTQLDLSGYLKIEDVMLATNEDINALFTTTA